VGRDDGIGSDGGTGPPARRPARDEVERLLAERGEHLMRAAIALTGSRSDGEDLLQAALERLLRRWGQIEGDAEGYLRRILYNMAADGWRRRGAWLRKLPLVHASSGQGPGTDAVDAVDLRDALGRALAQLPPRQRAVLVLRYWEELSQAETAELLGCAEGTVKSAAARGLQRLRELTAPWHDHRPQLTEKR
jgi:RNA polymerase sigma-70 factor (sigma-E family)